MFRWKNDLYLTVKFGAIEAKNGKFPFRAGRRGIVNIQSSIRKSQRKKPGVGQAFLNLL
jgi:hypothetical protein